MLDVALLLDEEPFDPKVSVVVLSSIITFVKEVQL